MADDRQSAGDTKQTIERWLREEHFSPDSVPQPEAQFFLVVTKPGITPLFIFRPKDSPDRVVVRLDLKLASDEHKRLMACDLHKREQLAWDISSQLSALRLSFNMDAPTPSVVMMNQSIYGDALSKDRLFQAIDRLFSGEAVANHCFLRALGQLLTQARPN
jgi:hypothetical protein